MPRMRSILSVFVLLLTVTPTIGLAQEEEETEQVAREHPARAMVRDWQERMQARRQMHARMDPMRRMAAYAPPHLLECRDVLGLTEEQLSDLGALVKELEGAHEKAQTEAKAHRDQLMEEWRADQPDAGQLQAHAKAAMQAQQGAHLAMLSAVAQAKALLTPEQRGRVEGWMDAGDMMRGRMMRGRTLRGHRMRGRAMRGHGMRERRRP